MGRGRVWRAGSASGPPGSCAWHRSWPPANHMCSSDLSSSKQGPAPPNPCGQLQYTVMLCGSQHQVGGGTQLPSLPSLASLILSEQGAWGAEEGLPCAGGGMCLPPGPGGPLCAEPPGRPEEDSTGLTAQHGLPCQAGEGCGPLGEEPLARLRGGRGGAQGS